MKIKNMPAYRIIKAAVYIMAGALVFLGATNPLQAQNRSMARVPKNAVIFVVNQTDAQDRDDTVKTLAANLRDRLSGMGFIIMDRAQALRNLNDCSKRPDAQYRPDIKNLIGKYEPGSIQLQQIEKTLNGSMAWLMKANYLLLVQISGQETKENRKSGATNYNDVVHTLRYNYTFYEEGIDTKRITGSDIAETKVTQRIGAAPDGAHLGALCENISNAVQKKLQDAMNNGRIAALQPPQFEVNIQARIINAMLPQVTELPDSEHMITQTWLPIPVSFLKIQLDGSARYLAAEPGDDALKISRPKGTFSLKISNPDLEPLEKKIVVAADESGQSVEFDLIMTESARERVEADAAWLQDIIKKYKAEGYVAAEDAPVKVKLPEAERERLRNLVETYKKSGYNIESGKP